MLFSIYFAFCVDFRGSPLLRFSQTDRPTGPGEVQRRLQSPGQGEAQRRLQSLRTHMAAMPSLGHVGCLSFTDSTGFGLLANNPHVVSGWTTGTGRDSRESLYVVSPGAALCTAGGRKGQQPILEFFSKNLNWQVLLYSACVANFVLCECCIVGIQCCMW